ncbi:heart and neural crest derivatives expressed 1 [Cricetulus griseus]
MPQGQGAARLPRHHLGLPAFTPNQAPERREEQRSATASTPNPQARNKPSWLLSPADGAPDFSAGGPPPTTAVAAAAYGPDARPGQSPGRLEALGGRLPRRKGSGPKKERRRTESINSAFAELRECIPNVPADTKLSKIKTLRLATSYIAYLMDVLAKDAQAGDPEAFKAELKKADGGRESKRKRELPSTVSPHPHPSLVHLLGGAGEYGTKLGCAKAGISACNGRVQAIGSLRVKAAECLLSGNSSQAHQHERSSKCACSGLASLPAFGCS